MRIGLLDIDGHNFPNLALMKVSSHHKALGHKVSWCSTWENYDQVYKSKVFTFTPDELHYINCPDIICGGTGYGIKNDLPYSIEHTFPDYSLYGVENAYGFLTRGCPKKCTWCIVPSKEGQIRSNADITEFWNGQKTAILMDNNVLAHDHGLRQIEKIISLGIKVDFNQGLYARIIAVNPQIAELLSKVKWFKPLRMACDTDSQLDEVVKATELLRKYGTKPSKYFVYVLVIDVGSAHKRVVTLKKMNLDPFAQPYIDFKNNIMPTMEQRRFARWVNHKAIFKSVEYKDYTG